MKNRSRKFCLLLYPDNQDHLNSLDLLKSLYNYAIILHDKDINTKTGEIKKPHFHIVIESKNAIWDSALSKTLNLDARFIQPCKNYENALEYLIHYNDADKYPYDIENVGGPLQRKLKKIISDNDFPENDKIQMIFDFINENPDFIINIRAISEFCLIQQIWDTYRRNFTIINKLVEEHNTQAIKRGVKHECSRLSQI